MFVVVHPQSGVGQGSVLGPPAFLLFFNDLVVKLKCDGWSFADDFKCAKKIETLLDAAVLQHDFDMIGSWCRSNGLQLSLEKCGVLTVTKKRSPIITNYSIQGVSIKREEAVRDLGVIIDSQLRFDAQVDEVVRKASKLNGFVMRMCKNFYLLDPIMSLFNQLVRPILEYCTPAWNPFYGTYVDRIEAVQHSFTRYIYRKFHYPYEEYDQRLLRLGMKSLERRREEADVLFLHKLTHSSVNCALTEALAFKFPTRGLRAVDLFHLPQHRTNVGKSAPVYRLCKLYNDVYHDVDIFNNFNRFKCDVKKR